MATDDNRQHPSPPKEHATKAHGRRFAAIGVAMLLLAAILPLSGLGLAGSIDGEDVLQNQNNSSSLLPPPTQVPPESTIAAGLYHTCALLENGDVHCWGRNWDSQRDTGGDATQIAAGWDHTCALLENGNVHCWGIDDMLWLDFGQSDDYTDGNATQITAGDYHMCALLENGNVHCWGNNDAGQRLPYVDGDAIQVVAGAWHTCVLLASRDVHCGGTLRSHIWAVTPPRSPPAGNTRARCS